MGEEVSGHMFKVPEIRSQTTLTGPQPHHQSLHLAQLQHPQLRNGVCSPVVNTPASSAAEPGLRSQLLCLPQLSANGPPGRQQKPAPGPGCSPGCCGHVRREPVDESSLSSRRKINRWRNQLMGEMLILSIK